MKANFKFLASDMDIKSDEERQFEEMLVKAKAKGSFMVFTDFISNQFDAMAKQELYDKWLMNCQLNLPHIKVFVPQNTIKKAVIIGGGPQPIPTKMPDGYTIFCVDRTLSRLPFDPNYVVTVDADDKIANYYKTENRFTAILPACVSRYVSALIYGTTYWYMPSIDKVTDDIIHRITGLPIYQSYGTVTNVACIIAEAMGAKEIVLLNTTFGYPEGTPHEAMDWWNRFKETGASEETIKTAHKIIEHPVWHTKYISDPLFDIYRKGFYKWLEGTDVNVINCTGAGTLYHDKLTYKTLADIMR